jgi:hypothetical protein
MLGTLVLAASSLRQALIDQGARSGRATHAFHARISRMHFTHVFNVVVPALLPSA